jgi:hypothetical protein
VDVVVDGSCVEEIGGCWFASIRMFVSLLLCIFGRNHAFALLHLLFFFEDERGLYYYWLKVHLTAWTRYISTLTPMYTVVEKKENPRRRTSEDMEVLPRKYNHTHNNKWLATDS